MDRLEILKRNTEEIVTEEELRELLARTEKPVAYVGHAPTGRMHLGHLMNLVKIGDFLKAGFSFKFLIADLHAYLDDKKSPFELLDARSAYMKLIVSETLKAIGIRGDLQFIKGSSFQLKKEYWLKGLLAAGELTFERCKRAASEVVRFGEHPKLGGFFYPIMQNLDLHFLKAEVAYGGIDQRGIYMLGREFMPQWGMRKPICVFTPLIPSLKGGKMSASQKEGKIDLLEEPEAMRAKVGSAVCPAGIVEGNAVLMYARYVVFPILENLKRGFEIRREERFGGTVRFSNYSELEQSFAQKKLHPMDLKLAIADELSRVMEPVRQRFTREQALLKRAFPSNELK